MPDEVFLRQIDQRRRAIAPYLLQHNSHLSIPQLNTSFQALVITLLVWAMLRQRQPHLFAEWPLCQTSPVLSARLQQWAKTMNTTYQLGLPIEGFDLVLDELWLHAFVSWLESWIGQGAIAIALLGQTYEWLISHRIEPEDTVYSTQRKIGGVYYTPPAIVDFVIAETLGRKLTDQVLTSRTTTASTPLPISLSILDPACGSGFFLVAAYQYLLDWYLQQYKVVALERSPQPPMDNLLYQDQEGHWHLSQAERERILIHHIYGVDIDAGAVSITKLALRLTLLEDGLCDRPLPTLADNIQVGNAVIGLDFVPAVPETSPIHRPFEWSLAFPQILSSGGFEIIIGNPPYVDAEWMTIFLPEWRPYCHSHYRTAVGNWDLFCIFIEKAFQLCQSGGLVALVVPNKLAAADYAEPVRSLLIKDHQLLLLRDYAKVSIFSASVYPLVFIALNTPPPEKATVRYEQVTSLDTLPSHQSLPYSIYLHSANTPWPMSGLSGEIDLLTRLQQNFPGLSTMAQVVGAATVAEAYAMRSLIQNSPTLEEGDLQVVNSGTIDRYQWLWGKKPLRYLGQTYLHPVLRRSQHALLSAKRQYQATHTKIVVAGMSRQLECVLDATGSIAAAKSTSLIQSPVDLRYLIALLNSRLINFYFVNRFAGNQLKGGYLRIGPPQLKQIPLPNLNLHNQTDRHYYTCLLDLVEERMRSPQSGKQRIVALEQQIDQIVYALYKLTDPEIELVETMVVYTKRGLKPDL